VVPLTVHTLSVVDAKDTVRPELAVATKAGGGVPMVWLPGELKVIVCAVNAAAATVKEFETTGAAAKVALPGWLALMVHVPTATSVKVVPLTVQTSGVVEAKETARPELAVADSAGGAMPRVWLPGDIKLMVCAVRAAADTVKEFETTGAAA
jgi:hypothetical protein